MFRPCMFLLGLIVCLVVQPLAATSCHSIMLTGQLQAGDHFEKVIGADLVFKLEPETLGPHGELHGWQVSLAPSHEPDRDYIYPVNPPLRFSGLQTLGPGYGDDTKTSLAHPHEMFFLLDRADYDRLWPLLNNALWPYSAPEPDKAADQYLSALKTLAVGQLKITVPAYDADPVNGSIRRINFQAKFTTPRNVELDQALKPQPAECPIRTD
jgi:hypothetical protein